MTEVQEAHSELPPSSSDKWFVCHAWKRLNAGLADTTSEAAEEGTRAHAYLAEHLTKVKDLADCPEQAMYDHLMQCAEWVGNQPGLDYIEFQVDFGAPFGFVDLTGTADIIKVHDKHLTVADLKYGRGVVEVEDNNQLRTYLVGAIHEFGRRPRYRIAILQPRAFHSDGPIREQWITDEEMVQFEKELEKAITANYNPKSPAIPGDHCRHYCKALGRCEAARKYSLDLFRRYDEEDDATSE